MTDQSISESHDPMHWCLARPSCSCVSIDPIMSSRRRQSMQITPLHLIDHPIMRDPIPCYLDWYFPKLSWWHATSACLQRITPSAILVNLYGLDVTHSWCLVTRILHHQFDPGSGLSTKGSIQLKFDFSIFNPRRVILSRCRFRPEVSWPVVSLVLLVIYHLLHQVWPIYVSLTRSLVLTSGQSGTCGHSTGHYPMIPTSYYGHYKLLTM